MLAAGAELGPYRILSPLGAGGMGQIYRAHDTRLRRDVAIKVIDPEFARDRAWIRRFEREARAAGALNHPNVCVVHDVGEHQGSPFVVMELLEGRSLREVLESGPLPAAKAIDYAAQAARGLAAAHDKGIVHRDLKPENLFVTRDGRLKLLDFGVAKLVRPHAPADSRDSTLVPTEPGVTPGTPQYMSPEQVRAEDVDARSDLFALGAILYESITGAPAFARATTVDTLHAILHDEPAALADGAHAFAPGLATILRRCLEKSADRRFQSAGDLAFALESAGGTAAGPAPRFRARTPSRWRRALLAVAVLAAAAAIYWIRTLIPAPPISIAVLPFANLSGASEANLAVGLHEELVTRLAAIRNLDVAGQGAVMKYAGADIPRLELAKMLGVTSVVEGSVQVSGNHLRVNVHLIDAATNKYLWAEQYDRSLNDAFAIQSDIAQRVTEAVGAMLSLAERGRLRKAPTMNGEAYRLYLEGLDYFYRPGVVPQDRRMAERFFEQAVALDPNFARAHAGISALNGQLFWYSIDPSPQRLERQLREAEIALQLDPRDSKLHMVMGMARYHARDYRQALKEFTIALKANPRDAEVMSYIAAVNRRLGNWNETLKWFGRSTKRGPDIPDLWLNVGQSCEMVRRYREAIRAYDQALSLAPGLTEAATNRAMAFVRWQGRLDTLRAVVNRLSDGPAAWSEPVAARRVELLFWDRDGRGLLDLLRDSRAATAFQGQELYLPRELYMAWAQRLRGDRAAERSAFTALRTGVDSMLTRLPDDWVLHATRGLTLAALGRRGEALREAQWLEQSRIYREDALLGPLAAEHRARVLAQAGESGAALEQIERLLAHPSMLTVHMLRLDPVWDPIRSDPRFQALLVKYARPEDFAPRLRADVWFPDN